MTWAKTIRLDDFLKAVKVASGKDTLSVSKENLEATPKVQDGSTALEMHDQTQEELKAHFKGLLSKIDKDCKDLLEAVQTQVPSLVIKLLKKVLGAYEIDANVLHSILQDVLKEVSEDNAYVEIFISQEDWETLHTEDASWTQGYPRVSFFRDEKLKKGDCLLKSRFGLIDGRLDQKILKIEKELAVS